MSTRRALRYGRRVLRVYVPIVLASIAAVVLPVPRASASELRTISRNTVVFVDAVKSGGEWAAYRIADERRPLIVRADGPGRVVLKVRMIVAPGAKSAVGAITSDDRIVLTARIDPVRDPGAILVEGQGRGVSRARLYVVRIGPGEHTIAVRWSEGAALLVAPTFLEGAELDDVAADGEPEVPLVGIVKAPKGVQRIPRVPGEQGGVPEIEPPSPEAEELELPEGELDGAVVATSSVGVELEVASTGPRTPDPWTTSAGAERPRAREEPEGPKLAMRDPNTTPSTSASTGEGLLPREAFERRGPAVHAPRRLTVPAPWLSAEVRGGLMISRLGLDPGPIVGVDVRVPLPGLDARTFSVGVSLDAAWARGSAAVVTEVERAPVDVATIEHASMLVGADLRWGFLPIEGVFEPWVGAGAGVLVGSLSAENGTGSSRGGTTAIVALARLGAAFGALGSRPFFELRVAGGRLESDLARGRDGGAAGYLEVDAVVGWRFELVTEAPAE